MSGTTCDTSVLIAALATWHPRHRQAWTLASRIDAVPGHVLLETYSVLTRLPAPQRFAPDDAAALLVQSGLRALALPPSAYSALLAQVASLGISGGAIYDALIAATVRHNEMTLVSLDQRARATYEAIGVDYKLL